MAMPIKKTRELPGWLRPAASSQYDVSAQFETIFLEHWPHIYGLLSRLVGDRDEAEDLALDTFLRLYQRAPSGDDGFNTGGWLHRVAINLGLNAIRSWKRRERYEVESGKAELMDNRPAGPAELFADEEQRRWVRQILSQMEPRQAQLLVLRYSDHSYQEIAAALGVSVSSVGTLLNRAESEFERRFRAAFPEGG